MQATILIKLANYRIGSQKTRIYLDILGSEVSESTIDITDRMGKSVSYKVSTKQPHSYRIRVSNGPSLPDTMYDPAPVFTPKSPQQRLPISQLVRDAICTSVQ